MTFIHEHSSVESEIKDPKYTGVFNVDVILIGVGRHKSNMFDISESLNFVIGLNSQSYGVNIASKISDGQFWFFKEVS